MSDTPNTGPNHATTVASGTLIMGTYEIEKLINSGGMGEVYRGRNIHNDEPVAIKIVLPSLAHDPKIVALFQKESTTLSRLSHEAIVRYHVFTVDPTIGRPCMVMEFVSGTSMSDRIEQGPMPVEDVRVMLRRVASGLDKAHRAGVVHRDLSPDNVILEDGHVEHAKLIDFGIAKSTALGAGTLLQGQFAGKFNWVSPEQLGAFGGTVDGRSDIYSLALVTAAASKGEVLPMGASIVDAVGKRSGVPDLTGVDEGLVPLLSWMLQPDPALRPDSMAKVMAAVDNPALVPQIAAPAPKAPDPNRTVIGGALPIQQPKLVPAAPIEAAVSVASVSVAPVAVKTSAPVGATVIAAVTQAPESEDVSPFGAPGVAAVARPVQVEPLVVKNNKSGLIAVLALLALGGGAAGAYFGGIFDSTVVPVAGESQAEAEARVKAEAEDKAAAERAAAEAKAAADAAATKAAEDTAALKAAADAKAAEDAAKQAELDAAAQKAADELAAQKAADEAAAKLAAQQKAAEQAAEQKAADAAAAQKAEADAAAKQAADEAAAKQAADAAAAQKLAEEAAAQKAADEAAATRAAEAEAQRLAKEAAAKQAADEAAAKQAAEAEAAAAEAAAQKAAEEAAAAQKLADEAAAKKAAEEAAANADPLTAQLAYFAGLKPPLCALVTLKDAKATGFGLDGYTADPAALASFAKDWQAATQTTPNLAIHAINAAQCPLIEFATRYPAPDVDPLAVVMQTTGEVVKSGANVSGKVEGLEGRNFALFIFSEGGGATNLKPWTTMGSDGTASFEFNLTLEANAPPAPQILLAMVTDKPLPALDKVPAGVTAQSLMPFLEKQLEKAGMKPTLSFAYFRLEN
ncbi:serine/threonine-protein kinase [Cypionkella sp.]|uniref:serine/threonine-protein kinase n=1 Tax=Cypionkella sp. TaxID=2811411 RepID=UPI0027279F92|nr:serine/threonine-protein kinase [Cypionkella sp.]MDO8984621.1 serine/threonine-protein kinase [Cypionkella sp.]MDP2051129.1 serine/threonine-protein kinase [Cypionkella sp.]